MPFDQRRCSKSFRIVEITRLVENYNRSRVVDMNNKLSQILKLVGSLKKQELILLNQTVVALIKSQNDIEFAKAATSYQRGDIVSFLDSSGVKMHGVIAKKNPKTIQVITQDNYYVNIPATYLTLENNPSTKLLNFKKAVAPSYEEIHELLGFKEKK